MRRLVPLFAFPLFISAQNLPEFEKRVSEFTLPNGVHFIVLERDSAPVVSFHTYVAAGSIDDPKGKTGLAHMFEHMAFKGTTTIGTENYAEEKKALEEEERLRDELEAEQNKGRHASPERLRALEQQVEAATAKANSYVIPNAYPELIEKNGGVGLNASTSLDSTNYFYSLPSNRIELWFLLESQRFLHPVFREFYKERNVVMEERRMRINSSPQGQLFEMLSATAFAASPYRRPTAGWTTDIEHLRVRDAEQFFKTYYVPGNITIGIAGHVDRAQVRKLAEKYFSPLSAGPAPPAYHTEEPRQLGEKRVAVESASQPFLTLGYKRPGQNDRDDPVFDVLAAILASGRTGMLYTDLVRDRKLALGATTDATFPSGALANLFLFYVMPSTGRTVAENEKACYEIIDRLKNEQVDASTLERVKTKVRASLIRQLDSNSGLAAELAFSYVNYGDWRKLFTTLQDIERVTPADVQRVARAYLVESGRTVAYTVPRSKEAAPVPAAPPQPQVPELHPAPPPKPAGERLPSNGEQR